MSIKKTVMICLSPLLLSACAVSWWRDEVNYPLVLLDEVLYENIEPVNRLEIKLSVSKDKCTDTKKCLELPGYKGIDAVSQDTIRDIIRIYNSLWGTTFNAIKDAKIISSSGMIIVPRIGASAKSNDELSGTLLEVRPVKNTQNTTLTGEAP